MNKNFSKYYGIIYLFVLIAIIGIGNLYLTKLNFITTAKLTPAVLADTTQKADDLPVVKGTTTPPVDVNKEGISSADRIAKGKALFDQTCSPCHGTEGKGDGPAGKTLNPPPRNFQELTGWTNGPKISQMYKTLQEGITARGMTQYNNIAPEDRFAIIHYIRSLKSDYPAVTPDELKEIDKTYSLSSGVKQPTQIPVKAATEKLINEYNNKMAKINNTVSAIMKDNSSKGAEIFRKISFDVNRSVTSLYSYNKWNENESQFVKFIVTAPDEKGFYASSYELTQEEWTAVYQYMKSLII